MGVREKLNQNKAFGVVAAVVMAAAAVAFAAYNLRGTGSPSAYEAYYTTDDGQTFFGGTVADVPPFQKDGKEAVRAHVYTCNGKPYVNHLERYTPEARKVIAAAMATPDTPPANMGEFQNAQMNGAEVKRPGDTAWVRVSNRAKANAITTPKCPDGSEAVAYLP